MPGFTFILTLMGVLSSFPICYSALHICLKPTNTLSLSNTLLHYALNRASVRTVTRTRIHVGSDMELQCALRGHGIPTQSCPVDLEGNIRKDISNTWFQKHNAEMKVRRSKQPSISIQPGPKDIVLGRGYRVQRHSGNIRFRDFLMAYRDEYESAPRASRFEICIRLTRTLMENGSRFLKQDQIGEWIEVDLQEAEKKVGQTFRTFRKISIPAKDEFPDEPQIDIESD